MPAWAMAGRTSFWNSSAWAAVSLLAREVISSSTCLASSPEARTGVIPAAMRRFSPATRTM